MKGNVMDMAVGVIIGGAFGKIVSSLVADIITPLLGLLIGGVNFSELKIEKIGLNYGVFIQNTFDFIIIALSIFVFIRVIARLNTKSAELMETAKKKALGLVGKKEDEPEEKEDAAPAAAPATPAAPAAEAPAAEAPAAPALDNALLTEIRDLLKQIAEK